MSRHGDGCEMHKKIEKKKLNPSFLSLCLYDVNRAGLSSLQPYPPLVVVFPTSIAAYIQLVFFNATQRMSITSVLLLFCLYTEKRKK